MVTIKGINVAGPTRITIPAGNLALGTLAIPASLIGIVKYAYLDLVIGQIKAAAAAQTDGAQIIEVDNVAAGGYTTAITVPTTSLRAEVGTFRGSTYLCGTTDIKAKATLGETLTARWTAALGTNTIDLYDVHLELRLIF
jgi:hypothetical protein